MADRRRDFRPERRRLLDSLWPLLISKIDLTTGLVTICLSTIARELSVNDNGEVVTPSRISRLIKELVKYGLIEVQQLEWDGKRNMFMPKYIALTRQGWMLTGCNMEKLYREQQHRLNALSGSDTPQSLTMARQSWLAKKRLATLINRNHAISSHYRATHLKSLSFEERRHAVASWLCKKLTISERELMKDKLKNIVCRELSRMGILSN
jgi:DNA-binding MarR family transcriptional regulator